MRSVCNLLTPSIVAFPCRLFIAVAKRQNNFQCFGQFVKLTVDDLLFFIRFSLEGMYGVVVIYTAHMTRATVLRSLSIYEKAVDQILMFCEYEMNIIIQKPLFIEPIG